MLISLQVFSEICLHSILQIQIKRQDYVEIEDTNNNIYTLIYIIIIELVLLMLF